MAKKIEHKFVGGTVVETKTEERNGVKVGIVEGYIATWDLDRGDYFGVKDRFTKGAFVESILEHITKKRQVRLKDHHGRTVGGFPIEFVKEDERGLFGIGEINLEVQQGREAFALAKQGVLTDFSIGFSVVEFEMDGDVRTITKAVIWEGSVVDEPMNPHANITQVKSLVPFQDLELAPVGTEWDEKAAIERVREFSGSEDAPSESYKTFFVWYDEKAPENFDSYKLLIADVVDQQIKAIPEALFAAADAVQDAEVLLKKEDIAHIESYYVKMNLASPFKAEPTYYSAADIKDWTERDFEKALRKGARFSKSAARTLLDITRSTEHSDAADFSNVLSELKGIAAFIGAGSGG